MKWKNLDVGACPYYITATFTEWLPLFDRQDVRNIVAREIESCLSAIKADLLAYVFMPDHLHTPVSLPAEGELRRFCRVWRGRSARYIIDLLVDEGNEAVLEILARHANGAARYAVWKEQVRALAVWDEKKLREKVDYIHANPVRRGLVSSPDEWPLSSFTAAMSGEDVSLAHCLTKCHES